MIDFDYRPMDLEVEDYQENENIMTFSNNDVGLIYGALKSYRMKLLVGKKGDYIRDINSIDEILLEIDSQEVPF